MLASHTRVTAIALAALLSATALSGCSALGGDSGSTEVTLADTKSPVQLLRNSAASRIQEHYVDKILTTTDESTPCVTEETDPDGHLRSWKSTVRFALLPNADVGAVTGELTDSFVDQGWDQGIFGTDAIIELTRGSSDTVIHISNKPGSEKERTGAELQLQVQGPCVMTEGETSAEVTSLEAAG